MLPAPTVVHRNPRMTSAHWNAVHIMIVHDAVTVDDLEQAVRTHHALGQEYPSATASFVYVKAGTALIDGPARRAAGRLFHELHPSIRAGATVIDGHGFWASAARSAMTAVLFVAMQSYPYRVFGRTDQAASWLLKTADMPQDASALVQAVEHLITVDEDG